MSKNVRYDSLERALAATKDNTTLEGLSRGLFTQNVESQAVGIINGFEGNIEAVELGLCTRQQYNYGEAIALVRDGKAYEVLDETIRRYAYAVEFVGGNNAYKLGIHFDEQMLQWARAVQPYLTNIWLQTQPGYWTPLEMEADGLLMWLDGTEASSKTIDGSMLRWESKTARVNGVRDTLQNATITSDGVNLPSQSRLFLDFPTLISCSFTITDNITASAAFNPGGADNIAAIHGQNVTDPSDYTFAYVRTDSFDISLDGGGKSRTGTARINGNTSQVGGNVSVPNINSNVNTRPVEALTVNYEQNDIAVSFLGCFRNNAGFFYAQGDLKQALFFSRNITSDEADLLEAYFNPIYGNGTRPGNPYLNNLPILPFRISAGEYTNYFDTTPGDAFAGWRDDDDVDTAGNEFNQFISGGNNEWTEYEVVITIPGKYKLSIDLATGSVGTKTMTFSTAGQSVVISTTEEPGWGTYTEYSNDTDTLDLAAGTYVIRATVGNFFNWRWFTLTYDSPLS